MKKVAVGRLVPVLAAGLLMLLGDRLQAQSAAVEQEQLQQIIVTGSRIAREGAEAQQPISIINRDAIDKTNLQSLGDLLQQLTTSGSALNTKFNSSGNFGYPPDGGGIGAGSSQVDLRNLDSKRVLVLVDGIRWVNESSASGVSGSADLNTIPLSVVERIEVLEDGASAVYGSDAIAGVVNVITRKKFDGAEVTGYVSDYSKGGRTTEGTLTLGGSTDKFAAVFVANYFNQEAISSSKWWQSSFPEPLAGLAAGSSATPQGRNIFCDPRVPPPAYGSCTADQSHYYDVTLNNGTTTPVWNPLDPTGGTYHNFGGQDRFNYAPYNDLLTPSERKSIFTNVTYNVNDDVRLHAKGLFNNRLSQNQAAPEPIFVGPLAGTGGIADTITVAANNPYNPFGITLDPASNFGFITKRPVEVGPRIFNQDVNTYYLNVGMDGDLHFWNGLKWEVNAAYADNKAEQTFYNGYNIGKIAIALGDVNVCNATPGCVPLNLFGGQGAPMTPAMINYIRATQLDSSDEKLALVSGDVTGTMFHIQGRAAAFAVGAEHRKYDAAFNPDPLRTTGESQDSPAFPVNASYHVNEAYAEFNLPVLASFDTSGAVRYSDYSTFGSATTGKLGFRWAPIDDVAVRGTYSTGFRAPNLGELYGLTQFSANIVDPCGPTSGAVVTGPPVTPLQKACVAQGVPVGYVQANTQILSFTGGNSALQPEKSDSYTVGLQLLRAPRAEGGITEKLTAETTYYHHKITGAIQPEDLQALLISCLAVGGTEPTLCSPFSRGPSGNLNPPNNFLQNFGEITTGGVDLKINWTGAPTPWGRPSLAVQSTYVDSYKAVDANGNVSTRQVGVETNNGSIPRLRVNSQIGWTVSDWQASWIVRYIHSVTEACSSALVVGILGCESATDFHVLRAVVYNDVQLEWRDAFTLPGLKVALGVNNLFGVNPPICFSCTLNGYDAATYDLPGAFWSARVSYKF